MALQLDTLNQQRRTLEAQMKDEPMAMIDDIALGMREKLPAGVCLFDPNWHQGVVGILAGRIKERLQRPVICFAKISEQELKGSARSIPGLHIRDLLENITILHPHLIMKFGGHAMAAGLSILPEHFPKFAEVFDEYVSQLMNTEQLQGFIETDGELPIDAFNLELAETLKSAGPWGQAFPEPIFDGQFELLNQQILSEKHVKCSLRPIGSNITIDAIAFFVDFETWPKGANTVKVVYRLDVNEFRGQKKLQLMIEHCFFA
jgi:single-stranded-DNA-specific exonuclease